MGYLTIVWRIRHGGRLHSEKLVDQDRNNKTTETAINPEERDQIQDVFREQNEQSCEIELAEMSLKAFG